jgi:hypothetical protein
MPLRDLFKPRDDPEWKHPDPGIRAAALRRLDDSEQELIASLAQSDPAAQVRRAALRKVRDTERLSALLAAEADEGVRDEAADILVGRASSSDAAPEACEAALAALQDPRHIAAVAKAAALEAVRRQALARLSDGKHLAQVARDATDGAIRLEALEKVQDPALVGSVAVGSEHKDVALAALERIREPEGWRPVAAKAHNKAAARRARALLQALSESASGIGRLVDYRHDVFGRARSRGAAGARRQQDRDDGKEPGHASGCRAGGSGFQRREGQWRVRFWGVGKRRSVHHLAPASCATCERHSIATTSSVSSLLGLCR